MRTRSRFYSEEKNDFKRIVDFIVSNYDHIRTCTTWSLGRFIDWKYGLYPNRIKVADFWSRNLILWFDGFDKLSALVISEEGGSDFVIITAAGYTFLYQRILDWVEDKFADRKGNLETEITEFQLFEKNCLESHGYILEGNFFTQSFDTEMIELQKPAIGSDMVITDMLSGDYAAQRVMRSIAFDDKNPTEEELLIQLEFYNNTHKSPIYHPETDLCVINSRGEYVSGCEALINSWCSTAEIERVCTVPIERNKGYAKAVITECLIRLQKIGIKKAYITGYSERAVNLYSSIAESECRTNLLMVKSDRSD